jgi:beta-1,2-mannobiose phosphorylase / 1,2-beta-oligomannan phosphorylase
MRTSAPYRALPITLATFALLTANLLAGPDVQSDSPVLCFARELAGQRTIKAKVRRDGSDAYRFSIGADGTIDVESGSERGVLYAVYDVLAGKTSGDEKPAFSIRGLYPCEAYQRMTPEMMRRMIDRMGRWRMNTLPVISDYGYKDLAGLINKECSKRGIDVIHYSYCQLAFSRGIPRDCFAVDSQGKPRPPHDHLENEDRLCASNPKALALFRQGVQKYLREYPDRRRLLFATADGNDYCQCGSCRRLGPLGQAMPFFQVFMEESEGRNLWREWLVYFQRYQLPKDMTATVRADAIMFDTHTRDPYVPLHDPGLKAAKDWAHTAIDPRAKDLTSNRYLFDRLLEWRTAYPGKLYVHENLMIQGAYGVPRFNTRVYLEDLRQFQKARIDGVVYEAFECGIRPFVPMFDVLAQALWEPTAQYKVNDDAFPELHVFYRLVGEFHRRQDWSSVRRLMDYLLARPDREEFDWLFIGYNSMKIAFKRQPSLNLTEEEKELVTKRKLWDYMEGLPDGRRKVGRLIEQIAQKLSSIPVENRCPLVASRAMAQMAGDEFPSELVNFAPYEGNPVFMGRGPGYWDAHIRERGWILRDGDLWRMWYTGYRQEGMTYLGYATSPDGLNWKRYGDKPLYTQHLVEDMTVVKHQGKYYMFDEGRNNAQKSDRIDLLSSDDGIRWQRHGELDIRRKDGQPIGDVPIGTPTVWWENGRWYLLYEINGDAAILLAVSEDLERWTNVRDEPVLRPGPDSYDRCQIAPNQIVPYKGRYYLYYHGTGDATNLHWTTNVAVSSDLLQWKKYPRNPLFSAQENKSSGILVHDGRQFRLYTMHERVCAHFPKRTPTTKESLR